MVDGSGFYNCFSENAPKPVGNHEISTLLIPPYLMVDEHLFMAKMGVTNEYVSPSNDEWSKAHDLSPREWSILPVNSGGGC